MKKFIPYAAISTFSLLNISANPCNFEALDAVEIATNSGFSGSTNSITYTLGICFNPDITTLKIGGGIGPWPNYFPEPEQPYSSYIYFDPKSDEDVKNRISTALFYQIAVV